MGGGGPWDGLGIWGGRGKLEGPWRGKDACRVLCAGTAAGDVHESEDSEEMREAMQELGTADPWEGVPDCAVGVRDLAAPG